MLWDSYRGSSLVQDLYKIIQQSLKVAFKETTSSWEEREEGEGWGGGLIDGVYEMRATTINI